VRSFFAALLTTACAGLAGCAGAGLHDGADSGPQPPDARIADAASDSLSNAAADAAVVTDSSGADGGEAIEAGALPDSGPDANGTSYHDIGDPSFWSTFEIGAPDGGPKSFNGGTFDGRYVYFAPYNYNPVATRYDTTSGFGSAASWSTSDTQPLSGNANGFEGAVFDGRYVYLVPFANGASLDGTVYRYDTTTSFGAANAWTTFDVKTLDPNAQAFQGGTFDGRYVYFAPYVSSVVARFDTQGDFTSATSWSTFDMGHNGSDGAVFDGRYVYFNATAGSSAVLRYDTQTSFTQAASWSTFSASAMGITQAGLMAFDGRYVYLVSLSTWQPTVDGGTYAPTVARYDTLSPFDGPTSWATAPGPGFGGQELRNGAFDGRYIYLVPSQDGLLMRFDTQASFSSPGAWSAFDTTTLDANAAGFLGAVFDGRYLYLVPAQNGVVARFDAKVPPSMPALPAFYGSFH